MTKPVDTVGRSRCSQQRTGRYDQSRSRSEAIGSTGGRSGRSAVLTHRRPDGNLTEEAGGVAGIARCTAAGLWPLAIDANRPATAAIMAVAMRMRLIVAAILFALFTATLRAGLPLERTDGTFTLVCLPTRDAGGGNGLALVLHTPGGRVFLYDTGNGYPEAGGRWRRGYNAGRDTIWPYLKSIGVESIDGVFISHAHYDHFGGLLWLAENVPVQHLYDSGYRYEGAAGESYGRELADYEAIRQRFKREGKYTALTAGSRVNIDPALTVDVLAPPADYFDDPVPQQRPAHDPPAHYLVNANSLVLRIRHGNITFLLPGDVQRLDQKHSLIPFVGAENLRCDVLVAPGHGLHVTPEFARAARPRLVLASVLKRYASAVEARRVFDVPVLLNSDVGRITVVSDGTRFSASTEAGARKPNTD